jgi:hypothetical protein
VRYNTSQYGEDPGAYAQFPAGRNVLQYAGIHTLTFVAATGTLERSGGSWLDDGWSGGGGEGFRIRGTSLNDGDYVTGSVTATVITIDDGIGGISPPFPSDETAVAFAGTIEGEVVAELIDTEADALVAVSDGLCRELTAKTGYYVYDSDKVTTPDITFTEYLVVMTDTRTREDQPGKIIVGGFPDESKIAAYGGQIHYKESASNTDTQFGVDGNATNPVSSLAAVLSLIGTSGFNRVKVTGNLIIDADVTALQFIGFDPFVDSVTFKSGNVVTDAAFERLEMIDGGAGGDGQNGSIGNAEDCTLSSSSVNGYRGTRPPTAVSSSPQALPFS